MQPITRLSVLSAVFFGAAFSLAYATFAVHARWGLSDPVLLPLLKLTALFLANLSLLGTLAPRARQLGGSLLLPLGLVSFNVLIAAFATHPLAWLILPCLIVLGLASGASTLRLFVEPGVKWLVAGSALLGFVLGLSYALAANVMGYAHILAPEAVAIGRIHQDTMFHAATAAMLARFGALSTGLDGLTFVANHPLSHLLIGRLAVWLDVSPLMAYALVPRLLLLPLLLSVLLTTTVLLWRPNASTGPVVPVLLVPLVFMIGFETSDSTSHLVSESYVLSLILLLLVLPIFATLPQAGSAVERALGAGTLLVMLPLIGAAKITVGAAFAGGLGTFLLVWLISARAWKFLKALCLIVVAGLAILIWFLVSDGAFRAWTLAKFGVWEFPSRYPALGYSIIAMVVAGLLVSGLAAWRVWRDCLIEIGGINGIALTGLVAGLVVSAPAGAQYYLLNIGCWIAYVTLASYVVLPFLERFRLGWVGAGVSLFAIVAAIVMTPAKFGAISSWGALRKGLEDQAMATQRAFAEQEQRSPLPANAPFREQVEAGFGSVLLSTLRRDLGAVGGPALVYLPPHLDAFWRMNPNCRVPGWIVPGMLRAPLIQGVHGSCDLLIYYGFEAYPEVARNRVTPDDELCARARQLGFGVVLKVENARQTNRLDCASPG